MHSQRHRIWARLNSGQPGDNLRVRTSSSLGLKDLIAIHAPVRTHARTPMVISSTMPSRIQHTHTRAHTHARRHKFTHARTNACEHAHTHKQTQTHTQLHSYVCMTLTCILVPSFLLCITGYCKYRQCSCYGCLPLAMARARRYCIYLSVGASHTRRCLHISLCAHSCSLLPPLRQRCSL